MEHLLLKAATSATTDQGEFTAIAAAYSVDRVKDRIVPGAFKATIARWQQSGKRIPLHWNHEGDPKSIIGTIDPASMLETDQGLVVKGQLDLAESETAREAWRLMKSGSMSLSFGYIVDKSRKAKDGVTDLLAIDLFEISIVPAPANADTRVLSLKQMTDSPPTTAQLRILNSMIGQAQEYIASDPDAEDAGEMAEVLATLEELRGEPGTEEGPEMGPMKSVDEPGSEEPREARSVDSLRKQALDLALEVRSDGLSLQPPRKQAPPPAQPQPDMDPAALRAHTRRLLIQVLSGIEES